VVDAAALPRLEWPRLRPTTKKLRRSEFMYAVVKTGGKQYRVTEGEYLLVERLPDAEGDVVELTPLLFVDGETVVDGSEIGSVSVKAKILAHERGPKLRVVKFKPKRGYKRRNGHRQELTRIQVEAIRNGA
jgi:large subunit ribosomal protein L21